MVNILGNFNRAALLGATLLVLTILILDGNAIDGTWFNAFLRFFHALVGVLWIGLLYYFNFVQIPTMPKVPAELKPAVTKYIAPEALFWFRWSALVTVLAGLAVMLTRGHAYAAEVMTFGLVQGLTEDQKGFTLMGIGIWLAIIMFLNVWGIIWPNQKRALGIVVVDDAAKAKAARVAMLGSRTNLLLSLPMLTSMAMYQTLFG